MPQSHAGHTQSAPVQCPPVLFAGIAHRHGKTGKLRHRGQILRHRTCADQQHAPCGAKHIAHGGPVPLQIDGLGGWRQRGSPGVSIDDPLHQQAARQPIHQIAQHRQGRGKFQQQLQSAAARQPKAVRLIGRDPITHQPGGLAPYRCCTLRSRKALDQVILYTAARNRPDRLTVASQRHHGPLRPGRRAPGTHHRGQERGVTGFQPVLQGSQHQGVHVLHCTSSFHRG